MDELIKLVVEMTKELGDSGKFSAWRFIAVLVTALMAVAVWRLPDIIVALK